MSNELYPPLYGYAQQVALPPDPRVVVQPPAGPQPIPAQQFRLQKIGELETFLRLEVEGHSRLHKKYQRAVNILDGACVTLGAACVVTGTVGTRERRRIRYRSGPRGNYRSCRTARRRGSCRQPSVLREGCKTRCHSHPRLGQTEHFAFAHQQNARGLCNFR
jgi:hypothetical protein